MTFLYWLFVYLCAAWLWFLVGTLVLRLDWSCMSERERRTCARWVFAGIVWPVGIRRHRVACGYCRCLGLLGSMAVGDCKVTEYTPKTSANLPTRVRSSRDRES